MTYVTEPYFPNKEKYKKYIDKIYENKWVTNNGPLVHELTERLKKYLGVEYLLLVSNGTTALQVASSVLNIKKRIITSPFSFVATVSSQVWEGIDIKFADIDQESFNISPQQIKNSLDADVEAILPVHVFGNPCDIEEISDIAKKNNLKVIYDAAHAFDVKYKDKSILNNGDISILSFHATKLFHTIEGGALVFNNKETFQKAKQIINFGYHSGEIECIGINAKMNEFEAAMGLCVLDDIEYIIDERKKIYSLYLKKFGDFIVTQKIEEHTKHNYSYFPILLQTEKQLLEIMNTLNELQIFPRRYFYPSLNTLKYLSKYQAMPISEDISKRVLCLPIFPGLKSDIQNIIINEILKGTQK